MDFRLTILFFFLILFLIGFCFAPLAYIPLFQRFLLRSRASRAAGLLLLAMFSFLTGLVFTSRLMAEIRFFYGTDIIAYPFCEWMGYTCPNGFLVWTIPNKPSIINELWIESLIPTLSEETCYSSDPKVCRFAEGTHLSECVPVAYAMALIPAFITFWLGRRYIRRKIQLVTSKLVAAPPPHREQTPQT